MAKKGSSIKTLEDLRGKKIGFTVGSEAHQILLRFLEAAKLTESDVTLVNLQIGDISSALAAGSIDAAISWQPYLNSVLSAGSSYLVRDAVGFKHSPSVIIGKKEFLDKYPELVVRLFKVLDRSVKWSDKNQAESIRLLSKRTGVAEASYKASFDSINFALPLSPDQISALEDTEQFLLRQGSIRKSFDVRKYIDTSFAEKAGIH